MLALYGECQGTYELSASVNGKPSWKSRSKAIWYSTGNTWGIGNLELIGKPNGPIYTTGTLFGANESREWNSHIEKTWKKLDKNDFIIECIVRKGTNQQLLIVHDNMIIYSRLLFEKL